MEFIKKTKEFIVAATNPKIYSSIYIKIGFILLLISIRINFYDALISYHFLLDLISLLISYLTLNIFFNYFRLILIYFYLRKNHYEHDHLDNYILGINRISFFLNHFIFGLILINLFVINIKELLTTISIIAVAIVLIFKDYITNFLNGIIIMFSNEIRLKDYVKIGEYKGRVSNISFKNIELRMENGDFVYVPNTLAFSKEIINYSQNSIKNIKFEHSIPPTIYYKYPKIKEKMIKKIFENYKDIILNESNINIKIDKIEKDYALILFDIVVTKYTYKIEQKVKNYTSEQLLLMFDEK